MLRISKTVTPKGPAPAAPWHNYSDEQRAAFFTNFNKALADQFRRVLLSNPRQSSNSVTIKQ
jgi:ABC-type transporter MlaC component